MRIAIIGNRTFNDYNFMRLVLKDYNITEVISGGAKGADSLAIKYAKDNSIPYKEFKADWKKYGRAAGPIRNKLIIQESEFVIAFWDGKSAGTKSSINIAKKLKVPFKIYDNQNL